MNQTAFNETLVELASINRAAAARLNDVKRQAMEDAISKVLIEVSEHGCDQYGTEFSVKSDFNNRVLYRMTDILRQSRSRRLDEDRDIVPDQLQVVGAVDMSLVLEGRIDQLRHRVAELRDGYAKSGCTEHTNPWGANHLIDFECMVRHTCLDAKKSEIADNMESILDFVDEFYGVDSRSHFPRLQGEVKLRTVTARICKCSRRLRYLSEVFIVWDKQRMEES